MPVPALALAAALGLGLLLVSSKKDGTSAPSGPSPGGNTLDPGMPADLDRQVREALVTSTKPAELDQLAAALDARGFKNSAAALRTKAALLRTTGQGQAVPVPSIPGLTTTMDPGMSPELDAQVRQLLGTSTNATELEQVAANLETQGYRQSAAALRIRAAQLRAQAAIPGSIPVPVPVPTPLPVPGVPSAPGQAPSIPTTPTPGAPAPTPQAQPGTTPGTVPPMPPPPPAPNIEDLDPGIPPALAQSVAQVLAKSDLNDQELAFADQLANTCEQAGYPRAAGKLRARTMAIRAAHAGSALLSQITTILTAPAGTLPQLPMQLPGVPPVAPVPTAPAPSAPSAPHPTVPVPVTPPATPGTSPLAKTYKVVRGDNPYKIAQKFTGNGGRYTELAAANPDKSARILKGLIYENETLTLPDAWPAKPGAAPQPTTPASAPTVPPSITIPIPGMQPVTIPVPGLPGSVPLPANIPIPGITPSAPPAAAAFTSYQVKAGDSPFKIAQKFTGSGSRFTELAAANPDKSDRIKKGLIYAGESLKLPATWSTATATPQASAGFDPDAIAGVLEIIGAKNHGYDRNANGYHG